MPTVSKPPSNLLAASISAASLLSQGLDTADSSDNSGQDGLATQVVTAKTATPTKVDSKQTGVQLESHRRATKALEGLRNGAKPLRLRRLETEVWWIAQKTLLSEYRTN